MESMIRQTFAKNLKQRLKSIKMSQSELARQAGLTQALISGIVSGRRGPNLKTLSKILSVIPFKFEDLVDAQPEVPTESQQQMEKAVDEFRDSPQADQAPKDPFEFFESPWWLDMNKKLCADGWPVVVVPLNCMLRDAKAAYQKVCLERDAARADADRHATLDYWAERGKEAESERESLKLKVGELEKSLSRNERAVKLVYYVERTRGYPTGPEWIDLMKAMRSELDCEAIERAPAAPTVTEQRCVLDFPQAWAFIRDTRPEDHDPKCSWRQMDGALLCDCSVLRDEYDRRAREMENAT